MAVFYVDYENGSDSNTGTTFSTRKKTIQSAITAASAGDTIRVAKSPDPTSIGSGTIPNPHASIHNTRTVSTITYSTVTGETTISVSSHNCSTGDIVSIFNNSSTPEINGTFEVTVVNSSTLKLNDYNAGTTGTSSGGKFRVISGKCIRLATAVTQDIASFAPARAAWTASANVTTSRYFNHGDWSSGKATMQGGGSDQIDISSTFTTGKAAYYTLPSTLDLSGYQQLSLYIHQFSGTKSATGNISIRLCSDTTGDTTVNTFTIPIYGTTSGTTSNPWIPVTVDLGSNMGNSIQSVALYVDSDLGAQSFRMCNILACKAKSSADSLTLSSLVGRNSTTVDDQKFWYGVEAIEGDGKIIVLGPMSRYNYQRTSHYYAIHAAWLGDTGGTYTFYKRECIVTDNVTGSSTTVQQVTKSGTSGNKITISGGWDTSTSMTTQNGHSFFDGRSVDTGIGLHINNYSYISIEKLGMFRYYQGFYLRFSYYLSVLDCYAGNCRQNGFYYDYNDYAEDIEIYHASGGGSTYPIQIRYVDNARPLSNGYTRKIYNASSSEAINVYGNGSGGALEIDTLWQAYFTNYSYFQSNYGLSIENFISPQGSTYSSHRYYFSYSAVPVEINNLTIHNSYYGIYLYQGAITVQNYTQTESSSYGYDSSYYSLYLDSTSTVRILSGTVAEEFRLGNGSELYVKGVTTTGTTIYSLNDAASRFYAKDHDGVSGDYFTGYQYGNLTSDTSTRHTASGLSWKADITSSSASYGNGIYWDICKVAVEANSQMTASIWIYRTGTGAHGGLRIDGGQLSGIGATSAYCMGSAGSWEQVSLTATPTEDGILTIQAEAYYESSTSHDVYFDDFDVTQA